MQQPCVRAEVSLHVGQPQEPEHERVEGLAGHLAPRGERGQDLVVLQGPPGLPEEEALTEDASAKVCPQPALDVQDRPAAWELEGAEALAGEGVDDVHGALGVVRHRRGHA